MEINKIVELIAAKNNIDILNINKFNTGHINQVFNLNDKYVVKIEGDPSISTELFNGQPEKVEALLQKGAKVPKIMDYGEAGGKAYLLMEKMEGQNLVCGWWKFSDQQKEKYIEQIAEQLKIFHSIKSDKYFDNFTILKDAITKKTNFSDVNKNALNPEYVQCVEILENFFKDKIEILNEEGTAVLNHNDLYFENIFYKDDKITGIIDFDYSTYAPKNYEFKKLVDFVHTPNDYVQGELQSKYESLQLMGELKMLKKYYPALFEDPSLIDRVKLYSIGWLLETIVDCQKGRWSENTLVKIQKKIQDWYQNNWLERLLG